MKILYVDEIINEGLTGLVRDKNKIMKNQDVIQPGMSEALTDYLIEYNQFSQARIAGRFVCITTFSLTEPSIMVIDDLRRDEQKMNELLSELHSTDLIQVVRNAFELFKTDDTGYYDFEIREGLFPTND